MVKVGMIGAGSLANHMHYPSLAAIASAEIAAICDLDEKKLTKTADTYGVSDRYDDYHSMLKQSDLDAVYVVMPPLGSFTDIVVDCLNAGKHVFVEKPPGLTAAETRKMLEAAKANGRKTMVGFNRRFAPVLREAHERVRAQGIPSQCMVEFHKNMRASGPYYGVNILRTDVIHVIDVMRWIGGEVEDVIGYGDCAHADWESVHSALVRFASGTVGILSANRANGGRYERFEIHGCGISAYVRAPERAEIWTDGEKEPLELTPQELIGTTENRIAYGYELEDRHFIDCIANDRLPETSLEDAVKTMELVEALVALNKNGRRYGIERDSESARPGA